VKCYALQSRIGRHVFPFGDARLQRIAFHLRIVLQHEQREFAVEIGPVALAAQFQQPVVAHAVGNGHALVFGEIRHDFGRRGRGEARFEPIIVDVTGNWIIRQARRQGRGFIGIVLADGVAQLQENVIVGVAVARIGQDGGQHGRADGGFLHRAVHGCRVGLGHIGRLGQCSTGCGRDQRAH
jgi:hypothetical protein